MAGGNPKPAPDGTPAHDAWLLTPGPIAFNHAGELYFAEQKTCVIRKVDANGILRMFAGTGKCAAVSSTPALPDLMTIRSMVSTARIVFGCLTAPRCTLLRRWLDALGAASAIAFDAKGRLYLMNTYSLDRVSPGGSTQNIISLHSGIFVPLAGLTGLGVDPAKNVYFASRADGLVYRVNDDGSYTAAHEVPPLVGFAIDAAGTVWGGPFYNEIFSPMLPAHFRWAGPIKAIRATVDRRSRHAFIPLARLSSRLTATCMSSMVTGSAGSPASSHRRRR